jgi:hypothetical protein
LCNEHGWQTQGQEQKKGGLNPQHRLRDTPGTAQQV